MSAPSGLAPRVAAVDWRQKRFGPVGCQESLTVESEHDLGPIAASLPLSVHAVSIGPKEDMAVEQRIPVAGIEAIVERTGKGGWWHRPLVTDEHTLRQTDIVRSVLSEPRCTLGGGNVGQVEQPFCAHQSMLQDRR